MKDKIPHITWCATGPLAFLPLHAAGIYNPCGECQISVLDFIASSYTPTLSALILVHKVHNPSEIPSVLAISQPATPHHNTLPGTVTEIRAIKNHLSNEKMLWLNHQEATVHSVLSALDNHSIVHFACHAVQQIEDPIKSAFSLYDGNLELATLMHKSFKNARLAILSACQTATGDNELPEEAVHLAAGMLIAGFQSVIGTMWSIDDNDAPLLVDQLYANLFRRCTENNSSVLNSAYALHDAVIFLCNKVGPNNFLC